MKYQYRITTDSNGTSNYGYAYLAIQNPSGSGRKFTIRSLEIMPHSIQRGATRSFLQAGLYRGASVLSGDDMTAKVVLNDSGTSLPSTVKVYRNAMIDSYSSRLHHVDLGRRSGAVSTQQRLLFGTVMDTGARRLAGFYSSQIRGNGSVEPIIVNQNEVMALVVEPAVNVISNPRQVSLVVSINGKTATWNFYANTYPGLALFAIENTGANTVKILSYSTQDVGTTDTPTIRIVPLGQMYNQNVSDTSKIQVSARPMNSTSPSFASFGGLLYTDIGFIPFGMPEVAISPASTGTPPQMNYLQTRDFWGPMYRNFLVETSHMTAGIPDSFGYSYGHRNNDLFACRAGITINPGEGIAIVNSAETAVGVQAAFGAWQPMTFSIQVDVEPQASPYLTITGLVTNSEVRIFTAGTTTELTGSENITGGSFSWNYDPDVVTSVDIAILSLGYQNTRLLSTALGVGGLTIPVQQQVDRQYANA